MCRRRGHAIDCSLKAAKTMPQIIRISSGVCAFLTPTSITLAEPQTTANSSEPIQPGFLHERTTHKFRDSVFCEILWCGRAEMSRIGMSDIDGREMPK